MAMRTTQCVDQSVGGSAASVDSRAALQQMAASGASSGVCAFSRVGHRMGNVRDIAKLGGGGASEKEESDPKVDGKEGDGEPKKTLHKKDRKGA